MQDIVKWPNVELAQAIIRETRSQAYFAVWDQFSAAWSGALGIPYELARLSGPDLGAAIDTLFEKAEESGQASAEHARLVKRMQAVTRPEEARSYQGRPPTNLEDATMCLLAFITVAGMERLASTPALASRWLEDWSRTVSLHAHQQVEIEEVAARAEGTSFVCSSFPEAVDQCLEHFAYTVTFPTTVMAVLPFWQFVSEANIEGFTKLGVQMGRFLRLVSDAVFNPNEKINVGLFTVSATQGISLPEARRRVLQLHQPAPLELQRSVAEHALEKHGEMKAHFAEFLKDHAGQPQQASLTAFSKVILGASLQMIERGRQGKSHPHAS